MKALPVALVLALSLGACSTPKPIAAPSSEPSPSSSPAASAASTSPGSSSSPGATASPSATVSRSVVQIPLRAPRSGTYTYAQSGSETFCGAGGCSTPQPLPDRMTATISDVAATADSLTVAIDWLLSPDRELKLTTAYTRASARVNELFVRYNIGGLQQTETSRPTPAPTLFRFPYREKDSWSGAFSDGDTKGTYSGHVIGRESIKAAGATVKTWVVSLTVKTTGEYPTTAAFTFWVDPDDGTFDRVKGSLDAKTGIASYKATFTESLLSKP